MTINAFPFSTAESAVYKALKFRKLPTCTKNLKCDAAHNLSTFELGFINYMNGTFSFQIWISKLLNAVLKSLEVCNFEINVGVTGN